MNDINMEHAAEALAGRYEERDKISAMLACLCSAVTSAREALVDAMSRNTEAMERVADAADAYRLSRHEGLTVGEFMAGVAVSGPNPTIDGKYVVSPEVEFHDGLYANGGVFRDRDGKSWFALDVDQELKASNPQELREIAELFRTSFAGVLDFAAHEWEKQIVAGEVTLDTKEEA